MTNVLPFYPAHTALLDLDCQTGVVSIYAKPEQPFIERRLIVLQAARKVGMAVIHAKVGFRSGLPEVTTRNRLFAAIKSSPQHQKLFGGTSGAIHHTFGPEPDDIVLTKHRISAFPGRRSSDDSARKRDRHARAFFLLQAQLQNSSIRFEEIVNPNCLASKKLLNHPGRKITPVDPDHLGGRPEAFSQSNEIAIRADHCQNLRPSSPIENKRIG
jgi:hypothetical protein